MEYKRIIKDNYIINEVITNRFKTNLITLSFTFDYKKEDLCYINLLSFLLQTTCKKYNTKIELAKKLEDLYLCNISSSVKTIGLLKQISFDIEYINSKYIDEYIDKKCVDLIFEIIFNPDIKDELFNEELVSLGIRNAISKINSSLESPGAFSVKEFNSIFYKGQSLENTLGNIKDYEKLDSKKLIEVYKKILKENLIVTVLGDYNDSEVVTYIDEKLMKIKEGKVKISEIYYPVRKINNNEIIKEKNFTGSRLVMGYITNNLSSFENHYVLILYSLIFGGDTNSLLFKIVREESGLCYQIGTEINRFANSLIVYGGISKENYKKCIKLIKECKNKMSDENIISKQLDTAKKTILTSLNTFYDDMNGISSYAFLSIFDDIDSIEIRKEKIMDVTVEDIININKKIVLDTTYFLKGVKDE